MACSWYSTLGTLAVREKSESYLHWGQRELGERPRSQVAHWASGFHAKSSPPFHRHLSLKPATRSWIHDREQPCCSRRQSNGPVSWSRSRSDTRTHHPKPPCRILPLEPSCFSSKRGNSPNPAIGGRVSLNLCSIWSTGI